jgi:hypothetical protein
MSVNDWNTSQLIERIENASQLIERIRDGAAPAINSLERLQEETKALHQSYLNLIRQQLLSLEPLLQHLNRLLARLATDRTCPTGLGGQTSDRKEENATGSKPS